MENLRLDDPCVLFALRRERGPFCREFRPQQTFSASPVWARFCGPAWLSVLVVETGIGQVNVARTLDWLLARPKFDGVPYEPKLLIFAGFAGSLTEALRVGDIVLADEVSDEHGHSWRTTWPETLPEGAWKPPLHCGRLLTVDRLSATPDQKRRLREQHQAVAVDMESAIFAARCTEAGVPFACVRAISDETGTTLAPELVSLLDRGGVSLWRVLLALARRPSLLPELMRLARDTQQASIQLGKALGELLTLTLPWDL